MRRLLTLICIIMMLCSLVGCSNATQVDTSNDSKPEDRITNESRILIVYFSRAGENYSVGTVEVGNTAIMAGYIKDELDCDIYEIVPTIAYPNGYDDTTAIARQEQSDNARPEFNNHLSSIADYDVVFLGYPIWYGSYPQIILSFLDEYDFAGKTIYPFVTHGGSGMAGTEDELRAYLPRATIGTGLAISGSAIRNESSKETVNTWLSSLDIQY